MIDRSQMAKESLLKDIVFVRQSYSNLNFDKISRNHIHIIGDIKYNIDS